MTRKAGSNSAVQIKRERLFDVLVINNKATESPNPYCTTLLINFETL